jgi:hypothetical protein
VRFNTNLNAQDSTRISRSTCCSTAAMWSATTAGAAATLTSRFRHELDEQPEPVVQRELEPVAAVRRDAGGPVRVTSDFEDGTRRRASLVFGGNRSMPTEAYTRDLQLSNDLSLLQPIGNQIHRLKVGGSCSTQGRHRSTDNLFGTFTYASLEDFFGNRPERYERSLSERQSRTGALNTGLYIGDTWRVSHAARADARPALGPHRARPDAGVQPARRAAVRPRTDMDPVASAISPRIGFNYRLNQQGQPARSLSGGVGVFAGRAPTNIFSTAVRQTGLPDAEQRLSASATPCRSPTGTCTSATRWPCRRAPMAAPAASCPRARRTSRSSSPDQSLPSSLRASTSATARSCRCS